MAAPEYVRGMAGGRNCAHAVTEHVIATAVRADARDADDAMSGFVSQVP